MKRNLFVVLFSLLLCVQAVVGSELDEMSLATSILPSWIDANDIVVGIDGHPYLAVATGVNGVLIFDCEDEANPELIFEIDDVEAYGVWFNVLDLFIAAGDDGVYTYYGNATDGYTERGHVDTPGFASKLHLSYGSDYLLVADGEEGMSIIDVSNSFEPALVSTYSYPNGNDAVDVDGWGTYAMLANGEFGFELIDISDPENPSQLDRISTECNNVVSNGSAEYAFYTSSNQDTWNRLVWLNLTDMENIEYYDNIPIMNAEFTGIEASGSIGFYLTEEGKFVRFWANNQSELVKQDSLVIDNSYPIAVVNGDANWYVMDQEYGFHSISVSETPYTITGGYQAVGEVMYAVEYGNYSIVSARWGGMNVIDMTDPTNPQRVCQFGDDGDATAMYVDGDHLWVANLPNLQCWDISNVNDPQLIGELENWTTEYRRWPYVLDGTLVTDRNNQLELRDVSDPANIGEPQYFDVPDADYIAWLFFDGEYVYVNYDLNGSYVLSIIDISDVNNVHVVSTSTDAGYVVQLVRNGNLLYLSGSDSPCTFRVLDISDIANPVLRGSTTLSDAHQITFGMHYAGGHVFIPTQFGDYKTYVFDVSDPDNPVEVENIDTYRPLSITSYGSYVGIADQKNFAIWNAGDYLEVITEASVATPTEFAIESVYPNPFNPTTMITLSLVATQDVQVRVYDIQGRLVEELVQGKLSAGYHTLQFNGANLASGIYFVEAITGGAKQVRRMTLVK